MEPSATMADQEADCADGGVVHHVTFDLATQVTELHIGWRVSGTRIALAELIEPSHWGINPEGGQFFRTAQWVEKRPEALREHTGMFHEHLDFRAGGDLMRSVENLLWITFTGLGETGPISSMFDLHQSLDDLLAIDRGWFTATPKGHATNETECEWDVVMKKFVRFRDPVNTGLAPVLLASWAECAWPDVIRATKDEADGRETPS